MRAREFTINVPITITINGDDDPVVSAAGADQHDDDMQQNPVMVPPLQQQLELTKAAHGKESPVIDKLTQSQEVGQEDSTNFTNFLERLKSLLSK